MTTLVVGGLAIWVIGWFSGRRDDEFQSIGPESPPPPHVSPFASPRTPSASGHQVAEGEVKP